LRQLIGTPLYFVLFGLLCGAIGFRFGWRTGNRFGLPLIQGLFGFLAFASAWRFDGAFAGTQAVLGWAIGASAAAIGTFKREPDDVDRRVLRAKQYREMMFDWLRTGRGPESTPLKTAGDHLRELVLYVAAAVLTANFLALVMGAVLLNYMNAYVAVLLRAARDPWTVRLLSWNSWSIVRVVAYVALGSASAAPIATWLGFPAHPLELRWLWILGGTGVVLDLILKLVLSRPCGRRLGSSLGMRHSSDPAGSE